MISASEAIGPEAEVDPKALGVMVQGVDADGNVIYVPQPMGNGKCYSPAKSGIAKCVFHKHFDPAHKLPSRCTQPEIAHNLTATEVQHMKCPYYEPREDVAAQIIASVPQRTNTQPTGNTAEDMRRALMKKDEVQIVREMIKIWDDADVPEVYRRKNKFTFIDPVDEVQGSQLEFIARAVAENDIAVLIGHLGVGKTTGVIEVAARANAPLVIINCDGQLPVDQIIGTRIPDKDPETGLNVLRWQDAPLLEAYRKGYWAVIDDYTFTGSDVFSAIFGLMTLDRYQIQVTGETVTRHPNFRLFLTTNPPEYIELYPNRQQPDAAFLSRIQARYWVGFPSKKDERKMMKEAAPLLSDAMLDRMEIVIETSREMLKQNSMNFVFSPRHAVNWARKVQRLGSLKRAAFEAFLADLDVESKAVMQNKILDSQID